MVDTYLIDNIISAISVLNRLTNALSQDDIEMSLDQSMQINNMLTNLTNVGSDIIDNIEDSDSDSDSDVEPVPVDFESDYLYGIGETCLLIDPFDNYRVFNLFTDYDKDKPLDLSDGQTLYIVFRNGNKEIRIPEYTTYGSQIQIDKTKGQVLFKITKKQALDIMNMKNREFYITRVYEIYDNANETYVKSDEEVIFSGYWGERNSEKESKYLQTIENLQSLLNQKETAMQAMVDSINKLVEDNTKLAEDKVELEKNVDDIQKEYDDFKDDVEEKYPGITEEINNQQSGNGSEGKIIDSRTILINYENVDEETKNKFDEWVDSKNNDMIIKSSLEDVITL